MGASQDPGVCERRDLQFEAVEVIFDAYLQALRRCLDAVECYPQQAIETVHKPSVKPDVSQVRGGWRLTTTLQQRRAGEHGT